MKIMLLVHGLSVGGTEMLVCDLARRLRFRHGSEVEIGCLDEIGSLGEDLLREGFPVVSFGRSPGRDVTLVWRIARYVRRQSIELIHAHQTTCYVYAAPGKLFHGVPLVFTEHGRFHPDVSTFRRRLFNRVFSPQIDCVTAVSSSVRDSLLHVEAFRRKDIEIVPNGIDVERFRATPQRRSDARRRIGIEPGALVIGTVGRLDPIKNQASLVRAFASLKPRFVNAVLVIAGGGPLLEHLQNLRRELGLEDSVLLLGSRSDVPDILPAFDVFTLPSLSEGVPVTILEAMAASVPIVATAVGGLSEILVDGSEACLIPVSDDGERTVASLVDALTQFLENPELRSRHAAKALTRVERDFSLDAMVRRYLSIYARACPGLVPLPEMPSPRGS